jgi:hypothetical protein
VLRSAGRNAAIIGKLTSIDRDLSMVSGGATSPLPAFATDEFARLLSQRQVLSRTDQA